MSRGLCGPWLNIWAFTAPTGGDWAGRVGSQQRNDLVPSRCGSQQGCCVCCSEMNVQAGGDGQNSEPPEIPRIIPWDL